jgi:hypothetical protein
MKKPATIANIIKAMTIQHQHPTKDESGQTYNKQNQQKTASTIANIQKNMYLCNGYVL